MFEPLDKFRILSIPWIILVTLSGCGDVLEQTGGGLDSDGDEGLVLLYSENSGVVFALVFGDGPRVECIREDYEKGHDISPVTGELTSCAVERNRQASIDISEEEKRMFDRLTSNEAFTEYRKLDDDALKDQCSHREGQFRIFRHDFMEADAQDSVYAKEIISFTKTMIQRCQNG